jgi:hypothetical protein
LRYGAAYLIARDDLPSELGIMVILYSSLAFNQSMEAFEEHAAKPLVYSVMKPQQGIEQGKCIYYEPQW